jgi:hypothetical protein
MASKSFVLVTWEGSGNFPPRCVYGGPIPDDPTWAEPWRSPWDADDPRPLVLVALSSGFQNQAPQLDAIAEP